MTDNRLLTLTRGDEPARQVCATLTDEATLAELLHRLLTLYTNAARLTRTPLGLIAIGTALADIASNHPAADHRAAAQLILLENAAHAPQLDYHVSDTDISADWHNIAAEEFNTVIDTTLDDATDVLLAVAAVWRRLMPELHTEPGLALLHHAANEHRPI